MQYVTVRLRTFVFVCTLVGVCAPPARAATIVASHEDAFIAHDSGRDVWSIGSRELELVVGFDPSGTLTLQRLWNPLTGRSLDITPDADVSVTAGGTRFLLSTRNNGLTLLGVDAEETDNGVRLVFTFEHRGLRLRISRAYACYPGSPTIETWTRISGSDAVTDVPLSGMIGWQVTMPAANVTWLGGLRSHTHEGELEPFEIAQRDLDPGEHWEIGATGRSTEEYIPLVVVDDGQEAFYGGIMWSGAWKIVCERTGDRLRMTALIPDSPAVGPVRPIEVPHTFFGFTSHARASQSAALWQFIVRGIRHGRSFTPLVTYNTWFAYGTTITEDALVDEIDRASALGVELFVVDAGWYVGAGANGNSDFGSGLGNLTADPDRFPTGLASLADYTHNAGMKFGLWVEPERVALEMLDQLSGIRESWLATHDGSYGSNSVAQVCLAGPQARKWLLDRLTRLIESVRPDYLKWDNNGWINCNRSGHGHGADDGNFAHVDALYGLLTELHSRFPDLLIENVSGGGNRLDFGMLGLTDVAWMDDRTQPSAHVRHNLEGLTFALPPAYLLSFVIAGGGEEIDMGNDLANIVRSRMPGVLGMTFRTANLNEETTQYLAGEIQRYKTYRDIVARAGGTLLSGQAPRADGSWDVIEEVADDRLSAVLFAFKNDPSEGRLIVHLQGLRSDLTYEVRSADVGVIGSAGGDVLMQDGIELVHGDGSLAHVLVLTAQP